jgi:hypothetical protein
MLQLSLTISRKEKEMKNLLIVLVLIFFAGTLFAQTATPPSAGDGSSGNPYQIATLNNLYWITQNSGQWNKVYQQTLDIDATTSSSWNGGTGFSTIGNPTTYFTGSYDGQTFKITGLFISRSTTDNIGLFGMANSATITNVKLDNVKITGRQATGGLIGFVQYSKVTNCYSTGTVAGAGYVGGLIGSYYYSTTATNCYSSGSVTGTTAVGGLIGLQSNSDTVTNCYSSGSVTGTSYVGGLIGQQQTSTTATNCYSTGTVAGTSYVGGLIGRQISSTATNCFWDTTSSGQKSSAAGTGKSTAEMKTASTFLAVGWDYTIWNIGDGINNGYPYLKWQNPSGTPLPVELLSFTTSVSNNTVTLRWCTATEVNNYGFEIVRRAVISQQSAIGIWNNVGFVNGAGTSNAPKEYSFTDANPTSGRYAYRLKQVDNDGSFKYSQSLEIEVGLVPRVLTLAQNYPNPFNPPTTIEFTVPEDGRVSLKIFDMLGREVATAFEGDVQAGYIQKAVFDASRLSSGVYFSRLQYGDKSLLKKLVLMK